MTNKAQKCLFDKNEVLDRLQDLRAAGQPVAANYNLACVIADNALIRQVDKGGRGYSRHTSTVSFADPADETLMIIGKLHDVVEDSDWEIEDLRAAGFSERVLAALTLLTHNPDARYFDYVVALSQNDDARRVKMADLRDNMRADRFGTLPTPHDFERIQKYTIVYNYLSTIEDGRIAPGTAMSDFLRQRPELDPGATMFCQHSREPYRMTRPRGPQPG